MNKLIFLGLIALGSLSAVASDFGESCNLSLDAQEQLFLKTRGDLRKSIESRGVNWQAFGLGMTTVAGKECSSFEITVLSEKDKKLIRSEYGDFFNGLPMNISISEDPIIAH